MTAEGYHHRDSLSFPSDRPTRPFTCVGAAVGLLQSQFPLQPIANATLESKGSFETIGFKRLFCPLFQLVGKVGRRRRVPIKVTCRSQQRQRASQAVKGYHHRYSLSFPSDRPTRPFTCVGAAVGLLQSQFPLQPIANATLESKGSFETIGFKRLFCPLFQLVGKVGRRRHVLTEVTRRRQQRQRASQAVKGYRHKYSLSLP